MTDDGHQAFNNALFLCLRLMRVQAPGCFGAAMSDREKSGAFKYMPVYLWLNKAAKKP